MDAPQSGGLYDESHSACSIWSVGFVETYGSQAHPQTPPSAGKSPAASINALEWWRFTMPSFLSRIQTGGWLKLKDNLIGTDIEGQVEALGEDVTF